jgi:hypothetical protein
MDLYSVKIFNVYAPKDNFEIHRLKKDTIYGLNQFLIAINKNDKVFDIEFLDEFDIPFSKEDFNEIDVSIFHTEYLVIDSITDDFTILNDILEKNRKMYDRVYIHTMIDNTSFIYFFMNNTINLLKPNYDKELSLLNLDDFLEGIRVGSSFDGGYLKKYILK